MSIVEPRQLRKYQLEAVNAVEADWANGFSRVGVVLPTGAGKSTVGGELISRAYQRGQTVVSLAHRGELLDQMRRDTIAVNPLIPVSDMGIVRAEEDDHHCPIVFATLQTLAKARRRHALGKRDILLVDEVHHAAADGFHTTLRELGSYEDSLLCGLTATMYRKNSGKIGLGDVIQKISYEKDLGWAIRSGFLVLPRGLTVRIKDLDKLNDVRSVAGDFHQAEMADVMEAATQYVVDAVKMHAADRTPIIFAASVDACDHIADSLTDAGYPAMSVTGRLSYEDRKPIYEDFRQGRIKAIVTVQVLTEGADFPMCDTVVLARPTRSPNLYSQMVGRALRLHPGKEDALVIDLSGSAREMRLVSLTQLVKGVETKEVNEDGEEIVTENDLVMPKIIRQGPVDMVTIDLLANSKTLWMQTARGVPFINLMENGEVVFIWPEDTTKVLDVHNTGWAIGQINTRTGVGGWVTECGRYICEEGPVYTDFPNAMDNAEVWIVESEQILPKRDAAWRRNAAPSGRQIALAKSMHIVGCQDMSKAQLSDEISIAFASARLDAGLA